MANIKTDWRIDTKKERWWPFEKGKQVDIMVSTTNISDMKKQIFLTTTLQVTVVSCL